MYIRALNYFSLLLPCPCPTPALSFLNFVPWNVWGRFHFSIVSLLNRGYSVDLEALWVAHASELKTCPGTFGAGLILVLFRY